MTGPGQTLTAPAGPAGWPRAGYGTAQDERLSGGSRIWMVRLRSFRALTAGRKGPR